MKITDITAGIFSCDIDQKIMDSRLGFSNRQAVLVRVDTDEGIFGIGESMFVGGPPEVTKSIIEDEIRPYLVGEDPLNLEFLWEKFYQGSIQHGRKGVVIASYSGIDQALWDIIGKRFNEPVYKLLGGFRDRMEAYASGGFYKEEGGTETLVKEMEGYKNMGFDMMKMKIGRLEMGEDIERVRSVRQAVGNDVNLIVDANNAYTLPQAMKMVEKLSEFNIYWFEEPLPPENIEGYSKLISKVKIPISSGEIEFTRYGFKELLVNNAVDIIQPDSSWSGGLTECKKIADLASAWHIPMVPHTFSSAFTLLSNMHLVGASASAFGPVGGNQSWYQENFENLKDLGGLVELDMNPNPLRTEFMDYVEIDEGTAKIPEKPGLGVKVDRKSLEKYQVSEKPLL